ncbi:MAG: carbohydrate ABC transporter permease [Clostridia bacterium]|nr:carbohydrate ABC transporter permease [Clostridia bacterium]MBR1683998.1 carbohydrate ABC transporter permease [Clostridia bacterium]
MTRHRMHRREGQLSIAGKFSFLMVSILCILILIPMVFTFLYSFFPKGEIETYLKGRGNYDQTHWMEILYSPAQFSLRQYYKIFIEEPTYLKLFCNSAMYTGAILLGQALVIPLTSYCLSRFTFKGRDALFFLILILMILPFQVTMAPSVMMLRWMGIMDTVWAVILPMCFSPFYIFLLRQFMVGIPNELLEAGMVDGVGPIRGFLHVILPVCRPIIGAAAALSFADTWNMVEQPLVYLANKQALQPLSVMFNQISTERADVAFAGSALYILPALFVYFFFQEDIVAGIQLSELK